MGIDINIRQAYSEVDEFLTLLTDEQINKIPLKLRNFFKEEKDNEYKKGIDIERPIKEQDLKSETLAIIAFLNLQYWCEDENEKAQLRQTYMENEETYRNFMQEDFNTNDTFDKAVLEKQDKITINNEIVQYKASIIKRIFNKIKDLFRK